MPSRNNLLSSRMQIFHSLHISFGTKNTRVRARSMSALIASIIFTNVTKFVANAHKAREDHERRKQQQHRERKKSNNVFLSLLILACTTKHIVQFRWTFLSCVPFFSGIICSKRRSPGPKRDIHCTFASSPSSVERFLRYLLISWSSIPPAATDIVRRIWACPMQFTRGKTLRSSRVEDACNGGTRIRKVETFKTHSTT